MDNDSFIRGLVNVFIAADLAVMWASMAFVGLMVVGGVARLPSPWRGEGPGLGVAPGRPGDEVQMGRRA